MMSEERSIQCGGLDYEKLFSTLSPELYAVAKHELGETEEVRQEKLACLQEWVNEELEFDSSKLNLDVISLLWFLRSCKYDVPKTQKRIQTFTKFRTSVPEWYENRDPLRPELLKLLDIGCALPLPGHDGENRKVIIIRAAAHNPSETGQDDVFKVCNMVMELLFRDEEAISVTGTVTIVDLQGVSLGHALQLTPSIIRKAVASWQEVYPVRMKGMHYVNAPFNINIILKIFKSFMKEKLQRRLHVHRNASSLAKLVPEGILPPEYGGTGKPLSILIEETRNHVLENRNWFLQEKCHGPFS